MLSWLTMSPGLGQTICSTCLGELTARSIKLSHMSTWGPGALYTGWEIYSLLLLSALFTGVET